MKTATAWIGTIGSIVTIVATAITVRRAPARMYTQIEADEKILAGLNEGTPAHAALASRIHERREDLAFNRRTKGDWLAMVCGGLLMLIGLLATLDLPLTDDSLPYKIGSAFFFLGMTVLGALTFLGGHPRVRRTRWGTPV